MDADGSVNGRIQLIDHQPAVTADGETFQRPDEVGVEVNRGDRSITDTFENNTDAEYKRQVK